MLACWLFSGWYLWYTCMSGTVIIFFRIFFSAIDVMDCCCYLVRCSQRNWQEGCSRGWPHQAGSNHNMIHPSPSSHPVDQSIPRNWKERTDLHSSTQTSTHICHGLKDGKPLIICIMEHSRPMYNVCQNQPEIHDNAKSVSRHCRGAWRQDVQKTRCFNSYGQACRHVIKHNVNKNRHARRYYRLHQCILTKSYE